MLAAAGPFRIVYLTALLTGLRRAELQLLVWDDVALDAPKPYLTVRDSIPKNHKQVSLGLHDELAAALRAHRPRTASHTNPVV